MRDKESGGFVPLMALLTVLLTDSARWSNARETILLGLVEATLMSCLLVLVWWTSPVWQVSPVLRWVFAGYLLISASHSATEMWQFYKTVFPNQIGCWTFFWLVIGAAMLLSDSRRGSLNNMAKILASLSLGALLVLIISGWSMFHWENLSTEAVSYPQLFQVRLFPEYLIFCGLLRPQKAKTIFSFSFAFWGIQSALAIVVELVLGGNPAQDFPIYSVALLGKISVFNRLEGVQVLCWLLLLCLKLALYLWAVGQLFPEGKSWLHGLLVLSGVAMLLQLPERGIGSWFNAAGWLLTLTILCRGLCGWKNLQRYWQCSYQE